MDSQLRMPLDSKMVRSAQGDLVVVTTSASSAERRKAPKTAASRCGASTAPAAAPISALSSNGWARKQYLSLMIEAGSKINWTALESGCVDRIFFYYGPKILGGLEALPLAGGIGRRRRVDAIASATSPSTPFRPTSSPWKDTSMFTGIIEEAGAVDSMQTAPPVRA